MRRQQMGESLQKIGKKVGAKTLSEGGRNARARARARERERERERERARESEREKEREILCLANCVGEL